MIARSACGLTIRLVILLAISAIGLSARCAEAKDSVIPGAGDDGFISCSILAVSPGAEIYQVFGHALVRMECPSEGLDFVFTFESNGDRSVWHNFLYGSEGMVVAVETDRFLRDIAEEGRGVTSYFLNLSPRQKQELWRELDGLIAMPPVVFDIRQANCMAKVLWAIQAAVSPDSIGMVASNLRDIDNAAMMDHVIGENRPWAALAYKIGTGAGCDDVDSWMTRTTPVLFPEIYGELRITSPDGESRPLVAGKPVSLLEQRSDFSFAGVRPVAAAELFALFVALLCVVDMAGCCRMAVVIADGILLVLQTAAAVVLMFLALAPHGIGAGWNWYLLVFNPLPFALWLILRRSEWMGKVYVFYAVWLFAFAVVAPILTSEVDATGVIVVSALAMRCAVKFVMFLRGRGCGR